MSKGVKILVVDDEQDVELLFRQKFRKELRTGSMNLVFAFSAEEAIKQLFATDPPDIVYVFSDINMPGMNGLELLESIKNKAPHVKVSMISAYGNENYKNSAILNGAERFFTKPIDFAELKKEVNVLIASA